MPRRFLAGLVALVAVVALLKGRERLHPDPSLEGSPYHPSSPGLIAATGKPQLLEFFHKA